MNTLHQLQWSCLKIRQRREAVSEERQRQQGNKNTPRDYSLYHPDHQPISPTYLDQEIDKKVWLGPKSRAPSQFEGSRPSARLDLNTI